MYWTLDTRPPTLDERIFQAKARHTERVEQIAAEEPVPQLEVPDVPRTGTIGLKDGISGLAAALCGTRDFADAMSIGLQEAVLRPGQYIEVSESDLKAYRQRIAFQQLAAQQNVGMDVGLTGDPSPRANPLYEAQHGLYNLGMVSGPTLSEARHTFQITKEGSRWLSSRGPFYHPPQMLGTLTEFV